MEPIDQDNLRMKPNSYKLGKTSSLKNYFGTYIEQDNLRMKTNFHKSSLKPFFFVTYIFK